MRPNFKPVNFHRPSPGYIVAPVASPGDLEALESPDLRDACEVVEFRIDAMLASTDTALGAMFRCPLQTLATVRRADEGGMAPDLDDTRRTALYLRCLPGASAIDVEVRSLRALPAVLAGASEAGVGIVASMHDFARVPDRAVIEAGIAEAAAAGASAYKLAATPADMAEAMGLVSLLGDPWPIPLSVMGMGPLGKITRLMAIRAGSVLNYGYLRSSNAPGQWPARQFLALARDLFE